MLSLFPNGNPWLDINLLIFQAVWNGSECHVSI